MRWRLLFFISIGVNVALAATWFVASRKIAADKATLAPSPAMTVKTNVVVRRQFFSWGEIESADYPTFIANLRSIDCPEQTIRDIIIADVNTLYAKRLATELVTPQQQWWRSEPDSNIVRVATEKSRAIDNERRNLLTRLLGTNWETGDLVNLPRPSRPGVVLDGPVLGVLPMETKQAVEDISVRSQERLQTYLSTLGQRDKATEAAELARLRQQTRDDLARVLTPPQLEEYLLRYSQNASNLRTEMGSLKYFNATPDEFRSIFRATDNFDQRIQQLAGSIDPNSILQRNALEQQRDDAIKLALGADRYDNYLALHDPLYRDAYASALQAGTPQTADTIYQINQATAQQQALIRANTNLTAAQREFELKRVELEQLKANAQAMGQDVSADQPPLPPVPTMPQPEPSIRSHAYVFSVGDTLASVAVRYGVSIADLRAANPDMDLRRLKAGDAIRVPATLSR
jgi:LysM repeat protein